MNKETYKRVGKRNERTIMKILLISTNADEAGAPRHVEALVSGLQAHYEFVLIFGTPGPVSARLREKGNRVYELPELQSRLNPLRDFICLSKILRIAAAEKPDIIHCHSAKAGILGRITAMLISVPWVYTVHGWGWRGLGSVARAITIFAEFLLSWQKKGQYIFVSESVKKEAIDILQFDPTRGRVIYNGVHPMAVRPRITDDNIFILMPARVSSAKDHSSLLRAFELLNCEKSFLIFCGDGTDCRDFIAASKLLAPNSFQRITFLGQRSDMEELYSKADVIALISHFEAFPLTIVEALSCGKAVVATDVGGVSEILENGKNGTLVPPGSVAEIVSALQKYSDPKIRHTHGRAGKETYTKNFTHKTMIEGVSKIYHRCNEAYSHA